mgnify:CR=1 FL=1
MIECKKVSFSYPPNETDIGDREGHGTLRNIDLSINDGDFVLLCGTSGCGKTTLTRLVNGLIITMESWKALSCLMEKI